jgi:hypothetical protein
VDLDVFRPSVRRGRLTRWIYDQDELRASREPVELPCLHLNEGVTRRNGLRDEIRRARPVSLGPADGLGPLRGDERADGVWIARRKKAVSAANVIPASVLSV